MCFGVFIQIFAAQLVQLERQKTHLTMACMQPITRWADKFDRLIFLGQFFACALAKPATVQQHKLLPIRVAARQWAGSILRLQNLASTCCWSPKRAQSAQKGTKSGTQTAAFHFQC